jgi:hypothetical protein
MSKSLFDESNWLAETQPRQAAEPRPLQPAQRASLQPAPRAPVPPAQGPFVPPAARTAPVPAPQPSKIATKRARAEAPPQSSEELVRAQFRVRFHRQLVLMAIMFPAVIAAKLKSHEPVQSPLEMAALAVVIVGLILNFINWRCPSCNGYLYRRIYPSSCRRCGVTFHD